MFTLLHFGDEATGEPAEVAQYGGVLAENYTSLSRHPVVPDGVWLMHGPGIFVQNADNAVVSPSWLQRGYIDHFEFGPAFDQPGAVGTHWYPGSLEIPPQEIVDMVAGTVFDVSITVPSPWGEFEDVFTIESGQLRDWDDFELGQNIPEDSADLEEQLVYYDSSGDVLHRFRQPSWSLLSQNNAAAPTVGGFSYNRADHAISGRFRNVLSPGLVSFTQDSGLGSPSFIMEFGGADSERYIAGEWGLSRPPGYSNQHSAWRSPLSARVWAEENSYLYFLNSADASGHLDEDAIREAAQAIIDEWMVGKEPTRYLWFADSMMYGTDDITADAAVTYRLNPGVIAESGAQPFETPPVFSFKATAFVKDFLDFEFK